MKTWKIITAITVALTATLLFTSSAYAWCGGMGGYGYGGQYINPAYPTQPGATNPTAPTTTQYYQSVYPFQFGGGCMGAFGWGGYGYSYAPYTSTGAPIDINTAATIAQNYVASLNNPDLTVDQLEEYSANFYVQVNEQSTGNGAFELLINKYTGSIYPEPGPNMMWNTKYGMMSSGILGGIFGAPTTAMSVSATQATANAQQYLNTYLPGTTTGDVATFYGYYTIEVLSNGNPYGMLSVNGYTGQVWYHTWHGTFIQELELS